MARRNLVYGKARPHQAKAYAGADVSAPIAGLYRHKLRSGAVAGGVRVWFGPPLDPITGEELDRSLRWQATFDGEPIELDRVWPACLRDPITEAEYRKLLARREWAREHAPESAYAEPRRTIDRLSPANPLPF